MRPYGPLRGREEALATALGVIRRTRNHRASGVVLVSGDPGIGKTALVSEIARQAAQMRIRVARTKCEEIGPAWPGAPVLGLLRSGRDPLIAAPDFEVLTELTSNPLLLVDRTVGHLQAVAAAHRVLVAVDDVHWADGVSRYALRVLISRLAGFPVVWVLASRSRADAVAVGAADVVEVEHICLGPLTRGAVIDIARDRLGRKVISDEEGLLDAAGGNAFLATQIVEGIARRAPGHDDDIPAEFRAAMRYRLAGLCPASRRLIEALAVAGRAVYIAELSRLGDVDPGLAYNDALDAAVASGLVISTGSSLAFIHDLVRQAMYESMAPDLRRRLHSRYAQHFLASSTDPAEAAAHAQAAVTVGDVPNVKVMVAAAEALVATSTAAAAGLALNGFSMVRPGDPSWVELGERAVAVLATAQRANDTITIVNRLRATVDDVDTVCRIETHAVRALWHTGRCNQLLERADRTLAVTGGRPDLAARFGAAKALAHTRILNAEVAAQQADIALARARTTGDRDAVALGLHAAGEAAHALRRHQLALKYFRELRSVTGIPYLAEEIMELQVLDRFDDAQMLLDAAYEDCHDTAESLPPDVLLAQAKQHYLLGSLRDADRVAASVVELGQLIGNQVQVVEAIQIRFYVALLRGELTIAARRLSLIPSVLSDADAARHPGVMFCQGWLSAARGDTDRSLVNYSQLLAEPGESRNYRAWWPCWLPVIFETGMACNATDLLEYVLAIAEEGAARNPEVATLNGMAANLRGLFNNDLGIVAEAIEILRDSPRRGIRAIGSETYGQMLLQKGQRQLGLDVLDHAWDDYDHMGALARRAAIQRAMRHAGARRTKWSSDNSGSAARPLTEAERRVVHVIADGHTDKSAAKLLGISENTVGTHIRSAYTKLGVQSRVQLANALRDLGELD
jgi:DNA-binding CsgD family transcriptional regulator